MREKFVLSSFSFLAIKNIRQFFLCAALIVSGGIFKLAAESTLYCDYLTWTDRDDDYANVSSSLRPSNCAELPDYFKGNLSCHQTKLL